MIPPRVLCLLLLVFALPAVADPPGSAAALQFADGLYARGMHELAAREYEGFLRQYPKHSKADTAYFRLGECYRHLRDPVRAERSFKRVFDGFPKSALRLKAGFRRAHLFKDAGQLDAATDLFRRVLREKPAGEIAAASLYALAEVLERQKQSQEAIAALEEIRRKHKKSEFSDYALLRLAWVHAEKARRLKGKGRDAEYAKALQLYAEVLKKPKTPRIAAEALYQTGDIHFRRKAHAQSAEAFGRLLTKYPNDTRAGEARLQAAWAAHNAGLYADALRWAADALEEARGADRVEWLYLKANCERQLARNNDAVATYDSLLALSKNGKLSAAARYERALTYYKGGRYRDAIRAADGLASAPSVRKDVLWLLAESHAALREGDEAIQYYRLVVKECQGSPIACDATYRLAHHLQEKKQYAEAARYYAQVVRRCAKTPLVPKALFASAHCLAKQDLHAEAIRDLDALVRDHASHELVEQGLYQKGMSCVRIKRASEAKGAFRELLKRYPSSALAADSAYRLGMLAWEEKKLGDAEASYRRVLKAKPRPELEREARFHLAGVLREAGKTDEAAILFHALLSTEARARFSPGLLEWLAAHWLAKKDFTKAVKAAMALTDSKLPVAWQEIGWVLAGRAHRQTGDAKAGIKAYREALGLGVGTEYTAEAALRLGELSLAQNRAEEAIGFFSQAAAMASSDRLAGVRANAYAGLGRAHKALARHEETARYFMSVAILYDDETIVPECLYEAAAAFRKLGKKEDALKAAQELRSRYAASPWTKRAATEFVDLLQPAGAPAGEEAQP